MPKWQRVEYWYPIGTVLKCKWDINWFKNPQGVGLLFNQQNAFLLIRVIYIFVNKTQAMYCYIFFIIFINEITYIKLYEMLVVIILNITCGAYSMIEYLL